MMPELIRLILGFGIIYIRSSGDTKVQKCPYLIQKSLGRRDTDFAPIPITNLRFRDPFLPFLSTAKDQKALNIDFAKPTLAQQFPAMVSRELGYYYNTNILGADANFI